jgi:hypothetical protein
MKKKRYPILLKSSEDSDLSDNESNQVVMVRLCGHCLIVDPVTDCCPDFLCHGTFCEEMEGCFKVLANRADRSTDLGTCAAGPNSVLEKRPDEKFAAPHFLREERTNPTMELHSVGRLRICCARPCDLISFRRVQVNMSFVHGRP